MIEYVIENLTFNLRLKKVLNVGLTKRKKIKVERLQFSKVPRSLSRMAGGDLGGCILFHYQIFDDKALPLACIFSHVE